VAHLQDYLDALPLAEESYPDYLQKASVYRQFLALTPGAGLAEALPPSVRRLVTDPEPVSAWIPEVHAVAIYLSAYDVGFADEVAYLEHWKKVNDALLGGPLYRILMRVVSPTIVLRGARSRWGNFHRGLGFHVDNLSPGNLEARLTYPVALLPEVLAVSYTSAFQAALELAGAREARLRVVSYTPTRTHFAGTWR